MPTFELLGLLLGLYFQVLAQIDAWMFESWNNANLILNSDSDSVSDSEEDVECRV